MAGTSYQIRRWSRTLHRQGADRLYGSCHSGAAASLLAAPARPAGRRRPAGSASAAAGPFLRRRRRVGEGQGEVAARGGHPWALLNSGLALSRFRLRRPLNGPALRGRSAGSLAHVFFYILFLITFITYISEVEKTLHKF